MRGRNQMRWKAEWFSRRVWRGCQLANSRVRTKGEEAAYNLIIGRTRVVPPGGLLHDPARNSLKVEQVVALLEQGHLFHALQAVLLLGRLLGLLPGDGGHVDGAEVLVPGQVLVEGVGRVDGLELLGRVLAGILDDDLGAAGVFWGG